MRFKMIAIAASVLCLMILFYWVRSPKKKQSSKKSPKSKEEKTQPGEFKKFNIIPKSGMES